MKNKYSTKLTRNMVTGIIDLIEKLVVDSKPETDDDKLLFSVLFDVQKAFKKKLLNDDKKDYIIKFSATEAIAMRIVYTDYVISSTSYIGNKLHSMANEIDQHFQI